MDGSRRRTKAQTLEFLRPHVTKATILPAIALTVGEWEIRPKTLIGTIMSRFPATALIVRSSRQDEGHGARCDAGEFLSVADVTGEEMLRHAVDDVIASYGRLDPVDEVLVQPMASGLIASGVASSCDLRTRHPYLVVDMADGSDSAIVTAGVALTRTFSILRTGGTAAVPAEIRSIAALIDELENIYGGSFVEIEFGLTADTVILFQCRVIPHGLVTVQPRDAILERVSAAHQEAERILGTSRGAFSSAALGVMPDWNPAEMIGLKPTPLAYDLYAHLITDHTWAAARGQQGYTRVDAPLMFELLGTPYIDIAASLTSFVPRDVLPSMRQRVVASCIDRLRRHRHLHDKIEFEILPTCHKPSLARHAWFPSVLSVGEWQDYRASLLHLTNTIIRTDGAFDRDVTQVDAVEARFNTIRSTPPAQRPDFTQLLGYARDIAAPLFARVARAAFIATDIVRDVEGDAANNLLSAVTTITDSLLRDHLSNGLAGFLQRHGHVRPGTYDPRVPSYEEAPELYLMADGNSEKPAVRARRPDDTPLLARYDEAFRDIGYAFTALDFASFAKRAVRAREYVKYLYAGFVSEALNQLIGAAFDRGLPRELLAFMTIADIDSMLQCRTLKSSTLSDLKLRQAAWEFDSGLRVPSLLFSPDEVCAHEDVQSAPNFITRSRVIGPTATASRHRVNGCIMLIEQADPGFDWIFANGVAGLVTAYGGLNSHMAVRCREMNVAAAIGVGPALFAKLCRASVLVLDCASHRIEICR
jgi:glutamine kinase